jgi:hypothetical protein
VPSVVAAITRPLPAPKSTAMKVFSSGECGIYVDHP